ncbi:MAG TPA: hypothetical protein VGF36_01615 [Rhodopila sp.]|jgi:hypothetical protein
MHVQLARLTDTPELAMSEADAKTLAGAAQNVLRHYSIAATQKAVDWITFGSVVSFMYVPRAAAVVQRRRHGPRSEPAPQPRPGPSQIFQFRSPPAAPAQPSITPAPPDVSA